MFQRITVLERIFRLWPPYRKRKEDELKEAVRFLVANPHIDVKFEN